MKKLKSLIALCLIVCICLSSMVMFASAVDTSAAPNATIRVVTCQISAAYLRRTGSLNGDIIGQLMQGEEFHTASAAGETWYFGTPGPNTYLVAEFGPSVKGYIKATAFQLY